MRDRIHIETARARGLNLRMLFAITLAIGFPAFTRAAEKSVSLDEFMKRAGYIRVDVKSGQGNHLRVLAKANGKKMVCMIDTGCAENVIEAERAPRLREAPARKAPVFGTIGKLADEMRLGELDRFELGGITLTNLPVAIAAMNKRLPAGDWIERVDVILGLDYLKRMSALISYRSPCLYLRKEPPKPTVAEIVRKSLVAGGFAAIPLQGQKDELLLVPALLNGRQAWFRLDTGAFDTVLDRAQLGTYGLSEHQSRGEMQDISSRRVELFSTRVSIKLGSVELNNVPVGTANLPTLAPFNAQLKQEGYPEVLGYLGPEMLYPTSAIIDSSAGYMYLLQPPG